MRKITSTAHTQPPTERGQPLFGVAATRRIELRAITALAPHTLMQRAGLAVARLAMALTPHARCIWVACGPGNNGGDGLEAATHLHQWGHASGLSVIVTCAGGDDDANNRQRPPDARAAYDKAVLAGVCMRSDPPAHYDLCIDALLGLGARWASEPRGSTASARITQWLAVMHTRSEPCLAVDLPTGLDADTGAYNIKPATQNAPESIAVQAINTRACTRFTLSLLTLKPGLFTANGQDAAGEVWFDDLGVDCGTEAPSAWLVTDGSTLRATRLRSGHASHKGCFGDVAVVGGESTPHSQMAGAALLAARAALHAGAGRVFVALLSSQPGPTSVDSPPGNRTAARTVLTLDPQQPELMFRDVAALDVERQVIVCGCGGGLSIQTVLPMLLDRATTLVLDADALNAIARDAALQAVLVSRARYTSTQRRVVMTPHPLEAARLLGTSTAHVQADRITAAQSLADRFGAVVVLKGSGTVIAAPQQTPRINASGNALLATAGTGDVLAGMVGAYLARQANALEAACAAVFDHGRLADEWAASSALQRLLTASELAAQRSA